MENLICLLKVKENCSIGGGQKQHPWWFGHLTERDKMVRDKLTKRIYRSGVDVGARERPPYKIGGQSVGMLAGEEG